MSTQSKITENHIVYSAASYVTMNTISMIRCIKESFSVTMKNLSASRFHMAHNQDQMEQMPY